MTSEVIVMNRQGLIMAADGAVTVTHWVGQEKETRYFKGANKLFQMSNIRPIGLMIYDSATLHEVPWELIIKDYRSLSHGRMHDQIDKYAEDFFEFIKNHSELFPDDDRDSPFLEAAVTIGIISVLDMEENIGVSDSEGAFIVKIADAINGWREKVEQLPLPDPFGELDVNAVLLRLAGKVREGLEGCLKPQWTCSEHIEKIVDISIRHAMKCYRTLMGCTGVVIAGFGESDYFPRFIEFSCYGFVGGKFVAIRRSGHAINGLQSSMIMPFATNSMINTFRLGIGPDVYSRVLDATRDTLKKFAQEVLDAVGCSDCPSDMDERIKAAVREHQESWFSAAIRKHSEPLARVVGSLSLSDMAALAKTLIELQSLKERVTLPTESVGGPIEVAAITKHDGFVWIERKHYFKADINPRFFMRLGYRDRIPGGQ